MCQFSVTLYKFHWHSSEHIRRIISLELDRVTETTLGRIQWLLELEKDPFTLNDDYLEDRRKFRKAFSEQSVSLDLMCRDWKRTEVIPETRDININPEEILKLLISKGRNIIRDDLESRNPSEIFEQELTLMAEVSAYFGIASKVRRLFRCGCLIDVFRSA